MHSVLLFDYLQVQKKVKASFPETFVETTGPITHIDKYEGQDACTGMGRAILDQYILSLCDILIISESGLGRIAAFMRNTDDNLYLFYHGHITKFKREEGFPSRIWW